MPEKTKKPKEQPSKWLNMPPYKLGSLPKGKRFSGNTYMVIGILLFLVGYYVARSWAAGYWLGL